MELRDFLDRPIRPGQVLVYPVRRGAKMWLDKLIVQRVDAGTIFGYKSNGRSTRLKNNENCVIIQETPHGNA
jgi:hypothetical protein